MTKIQNTKFKTVSDLKFVILNLFVICNFGFVI